MAGGARKIVIEFLGKDAGLGREANLVGTRMDRLGGRMKKVGLIAAAGLAAGVGLAGKALVDMTKNAADDQAGVRRLAIALKNSTGATAAQTAEVEKWISKQGVLLGVTDDELRPALQRFVSVTHDIGKAQKLAALAMDISAGSGKSLETVSASLARAQNGNLTGMARLGVATKDVNGKTLSLDKVMQNAARTFKGQAAGSANSLQGKMGRLKLILDETKESIGYKLIPIFTKFATWFLRDGIPAINKFSATMKQTLGPVIQWVRGLFSSGLGGMDSDTKKNLMSIVASFQSFVATLKSLWAAFGPTLVSTIRAAFGPIKAIVSGQLAFIAGIFKAFSALLHGDWSGAWAGLKQAAAGFFTSLKGIVGLGLALIKGGFRAAGIALRGIFSGIWQGMKNIAQAGINGILGAIRAVPGKIRGYAGMWRSAGSTLIKGFVSGMKNAAGIISGIAGNVWSSIKGLLNSAIDKINSHLRIHIGLPGKDINFSAHIPHLAKGGIVSKTPGGTVALLGEGKYDEAVVPLKPGMGRGGGDTYVLTVHGFVGSEDQLATKFEQMLAKHRRTVGRPLAFV